MAAAFLAAALVGGCAPPYTFRGAAYDPPAPAPDFTLTDMHGEPFRLGERRGQVVLLMFGYTNCPDWCPATLTLARQALAGLGDTQGRVTLAFVTVDPLRDTPQVLQDYLAHFHNPAFIGLTGDPMMLAKTMQEYGISAVDGGQGLPGLGVNLNHTALLYLIDPKGRLRVQYPLGMTADDLQQDLAHVLDGG